MRMRLQYAKNMSAAFIVLMFVVTISFVPSVYLNANDTIENDLISSPTDNAEISPEDAKQRMIDIQTKINDTTSACRTQKQQPKIQEINPDAQKK